MTAEKREAAELLAEDILANIELRNIALSGVMLKCARLARLLGDEAAQQLFAYEAGGYPSTPEGVPLRAFDIGRIAGRVYSEKEKDGNLAERMQTSSVEALEKVIEANEAALRAAGDRDVSISSANPHQMVFAPVGNSAERSRLSTAIGAATKTLAKSRAYAYQYANAALYELQFSGTVSSIFERIRQDIDIRMINIAPLAAQKTAAINDNLRSDNPEDWANAVHGCRRLLQELADALYLPTEDRKLESGKTIKMGPDNYINRLVAFIEGKSDSARYKQIVGSTLAYIGERLDAVFRAAQKGSHAEITTRDEAERYVIYT